MTEYTVDDFRQARFADSPHALNFAYRTIHDGGGKWICPTFPQKPMSDEYMARNGWVPVREPADLADGGVTCAAIEKEAEQEWQDAGKVGNATYWRERAEKAEQEIERLGLKLDEAHKGRHSANRLRQKAEQERDEIRDAWEGAVESLKEADATVKSLRAEQPRPLTADDVDDAMIGRACQAWQAATGVMPYAGTVNVALRAALTPPPAEDPEVVAIADVLGDFAVADEHTGKRDDMALARMMHRRGVRVTGAES